MRDIRERETRIFVISFFLGGGHQTVWCKKGQLELAGACPALPPRFDTVPLGYLGFHADRMAYKKRKKKSYHVYSF